MYEIVNRRKLNENVFFMEIYAPETAKKARAGQFIMLMTDEKGERIPLTVSGCDADKGTVAIIFQAVGKTTMMLSQMEKGDKLYTFTGPLGKPTELCGIKKAAVIGGGVGCAIAYPQAAALKKQGAEVDTVVGFRNKELIILEKEFATVSDRLFVMTDDGSYGEKGLVTAKLEELITAGAGYDAVIAIGPVIMMRFVSEVTRKYGIKTIVSLNPIMIDGTGMCGGCRVTVGGKTKFACVDGPDFDGHEVDFDELMARNGFYREQEKEAAGHICRLTGGKR